MLVFSNRTLVYIFLELVYFKIVQKNYEIKIEDLTTVNVSGLFYILSSNLVGKNSLETVVYYIIRVN